MSQSIYIRLSCPQGKRKDIINEHRVWDAGRFVEAQRQQYEGEKAQDRRIVSVATRADYVASRQGGRK